MAQEVQEKDMEVKQSCEMERPQTNKDRKESKATISRKPETRMGDHVECIGVSKDSSADSQVPGRVNKLQASSSGVCCGAVIDMRCMYAAAIMWRSLLASACHGEKELLLIFSRAW